MQLLEIALVDGLNKEPDQLQPCSVNALVESLPVSGDVFGDFLLDNHSRCDLRGIAATFIYKSTSCSIYLIFPYNNCYFVLLLLGGRCSKEAKPVNRILMTLASECMHSGNEIPQFNGSAFHQELDRLISLSQHRAIVHLECIQRLILLCKELVELPDQFDEKTGNLTLKKSLSLCLRILKLLGNLVKEVPYVEYDALLLQSVTSLADAVPNLFRLGFEYVNSHVAVESSFESLIVMLLEEFLHLVQVIFCNTCFSQNIQACIVASILEILDSNVWRYNKSALYLKLPLAFFPRSVICMLKLIEDVKKNATCVVDLKEIDFQIDSSSCKVHDERVPLLKKYCFEELIKIILPSSSKWLDNLMSLLFFLHAEGVKLRPKLERSYSSCTKASVTSEVENVACHEDEALFGDLFSEGGRSVGSTDEQLPITVNSLSSLSNMPIQSLTELLNFLKVCVFSPDWHPSVYDDGCKKLSKDHVDILLSILKCQNCYSEDGKIVHAHELCLELLQNLLTRHALSDLLEEYVIDQILYIENSMFVYNDQTLSLLAHILLSKVGLVGSQLRSKVYRGFVDFISEKAKSVSSSCPSLKELLGTLPSVFHIEIFLITFHLSSESEKGTMANFVLSSLKSIDVPTVLNNAQLSCWGLVVSRLLLACRHMVFYPMACPSSLLMDFRSKLREAPLIGSHPSNKLNDSFSSFASGVLENLIGSRITEEPVISSLLNQLIDIAPSIASVYMDDDDVGIQSLCMSWDDIRATFSSILGLWKGKKATTVEDLIIERYIFILCWDIPTSHPVIFNNMLDPLNMEHFFHFSHSLLCHYDVLVGHSDCQDVVVGVIKQVSISGDIEELGWDFLRNGSWLSIAVNLLNVGIWSYCLQNKVAETEPLWRGSTSKDRGFLTFSAGLVSCLFEAKQIEMLLNKLSSLLKAYIQACQKAFFSTVDGNSQCSSDDFSPVLLLKHTEFDRCIQGDFLEKFGSPSCQLEYVYGILSKLDGILEKKASGILPKVLWESLLHGFPSQVRTPSGVLLSCILNIRLILFFIDGVLKVKDARGNICIEIEVLRQILDSVMTIKFDRIFKSLHGKCEAIHRSLIAGLEGPDYSYLFLMKQMEGFLRDINSRDGSDGSIHEWIVNKEIDTMASLRKDPSTAIVFRFYARVEDVSEQFNQFYGLQHGDLLVLIESLDKCSSDSVNVKVFNFFVDILSDELFLDLKKKIQKKFLSMDILFLSKWLEKRLLGVYVKDSIGAHNARGSSSLLRESTLSFIMSLLSPSTELQSKELCSHLFEASVNSLDIAFSLFDFHTAKPYFNFVVQLSSGEDAMRQLLRRTVMMMGKLAGDERMLQGLKYLFNFLSAMLNDESSGTRPEKISGGSLSIGGNGPGTLASRPVNSRKTSEPLVISSNQEADPTSLECDATSADEDDDDGTSDGEMASIDKDDEEDSNSERSLASKVCTFTSSGSTFMEQHWYFCYTCDLTVSKGCCSVCAKVCHRGHRVVYSRSSRFFCDCGAGGVRGSSCQCLKPRKFTGSNNSPAVRNENNFATFLPFTEDGDQSPDSASDLDEDVYSELDNSFKFSREMQDGIPALFEELDVEGRVLELCSSFLPSITNRRDSNFSKDNKIILGEDKLLSYGVDLLQLKKAYKSGSLDLKIKADYSNAKELKSHLASGSLGKSLLGVSARGRLAVGEGDKVAIFDVGQLIGQATVAPVTADKANVKPLSKNVVRFEIVHLAFNPSLENYLAVAGYEDCQVLTVSPRGEVNDRLAIELALQGAYIRKVDWVPGSQVQLMIVTNKFVKIYDLAQDNISPMHYFTLEDGTNIVDATLSVASQGRIFLFVLSELGILFRGELLVEGNAGSKHLTEIIDVPNKDLQVKGSSLYFSSTYKLLFLSYQDGTTLICRLNTDATSLTEVSSLYEDEQDGKLRPAGLNRWKELLGGSGLFVCYSAVKSNAALVISMGAHELFAQSMRHSLGSSSPLVGITAYKPLSKDKIHCLVLHDDGSLQIYSHVLPGAEAGTNSTAEKVKRLGSGILNAKTYGGQNPEFPLDFFEKTVCITQEVKLGGDALRSSDSDIIKQSLASEDGFLESPSPAGFKVFVAFWVLVTLL